MQSREELEKLQNRKEKKALIFFIIYQSLLFSLTVYAIFFTDFFDRKALQLLPLAFCLLGIPLSKTHYFLHPREFRGTVKYLNIAIERKKKYLSGQAGLTYAATERKVLDLVVEGKHGKSRSVTIPYHKDYSDLKEGDEVILFRFLDTVYRI